MVQREVQSVEVSLFLQATEDERRVVDSVKRYLGIVQEPDLEPLEGHFGNRILHARWHLTGDDAWTSFSTLGALLGSEGRSELKRNLSLYLDEHGALYLRLGKQTLVSGLGVLTDADPVRVKVKPRRFLMKGSPVTFYERLMELDGKMTAGRKRKRYLLLTSHAPIDAETRKEFTRLILERFPDIERKLVWLDKGLIVRTDLERLVAMKAALGLRVGDTRLETTSVSGSISKLKRMASDGGR